MSSQNTAQYNSNASFELARNEMFNHILHCGVLEAAEEHQREWFDDTMDYLADRYEGLSDTQLDALRVLGVQYCRPVISRIRKDEPAVPANS